MLADSWSPFLGKYSLVLTWQMLETISASSWARKTLDTHNQADGTRLWQVWSDPEGFPRSSR
jgi:hypothetical protein